MNIQIFDFDGVICDSNNIKTKCLKKAVELNVNKLAAEDFEIHHKLNGGISRYEKFKRIIKKFDCNTQTYQKMINVAENLLRIEFENLSIIENTEKVLKKFFDKEDKLFIASGGNQIEIVNLCIKWDIFKYFSGIYGSPKKKIDISKAIKDTHKNEKIYFYGDSKYDYECSQIINSNFIFVSGFSEYRNWYKPSMGREILSLEELIKD